MSKNINMIRIQTRLKELFNNSIDLSDVADNGSEKYRYESRALAALSLNIMCGIDYSDSPNYVTDGYHDLGIDAIYLDEAQKQLYLVQSKWRNDGNGSITQAEITTFIEGIKRILDYDINGANKKIQALKADIDSALTKMGYQIHAVYIHTGDQSISQFVRRPMDNLLNATNDEIDTLLLFDEIRCKDVYDFLAQEQGSNDIKLDDVILTNWGKIDSPYIAYYGVVQATTIGAWYRDYGNKLFAKNIRFYKGNTDVNDGIKKALIDEPENFFYYNNGIKLLCKAIHRKAKESTNNSTGLFSLEGVSLVNGAQTTGCIGSVFLENEEKLRNAQVMIQLIDISSLTDEDSIKITKLSNTQNRIENKDFASLDRNQERIRQEMSFSHFSYLYKTGDYVSDPTTQITFDEAIVALACMNDDVTFSTTAKREVGALSSDTKKPPYKVLFNSGTNTFAIINGVHVVRIIDKILQKEKNARSGKERAVAIHGNRFIAFCILNQLKKNEDFFLKVMNNSELEKEVSVEVKQLLKTLADIINISFPDSYPANIFKNISKCKAIKDAI